MAKWVCNVCGYVYEGDAAPETCPVCKAPASKFTKQDAEMTWAAEHVVGVAQGVSEDIIEEEFQKEIEEFFAFSTGFGVVFVDNNGRHLGEGSN